MFSFFLGSVLNRVHFSTVSTHDFLDICGSHYNFSPFIADPFYLSNLSLFSIWMLPMVCLSSLFYRKISLRFNWFFALFSYFLLCSVLFFCFVLIFLLMFAFLCYWFSRYLGVDLIFFLFYIPIIAMKIKWFLYVVID